MNIPISQLPVILGISNQLPQQGQGGLPTSTGSASGAHQLATLLQPGAVLNGQITEARSQPGNVWQLNLQITDGPELQIQASKPLPVGTQVQVKIDANGTPQLVNVVLPTGTGRADAIQQLGTAWQNLTSALQNVSRTEPHGGGPNFTRLMASLPQGGVLLPMLLQFVRATQTENPADWIGKELDNLLKAAGIDLASDLESLKFLQTQPKDEQSWRALLFPYIEAAGEDPQQAGLFWRKHSGPDGEDEEKSTRFVLEVTLSELGPIQLDGLHQPLTASPDGSAAMVQLKLRLKTSVTQDFIDGLEAVTGAVLEQYGMTGHIGVETVSAFPVDPRHDLQHAAGHMNITT